jgi:adenine-specific DNA-methyltransferase
MAAGFSPNHEYADFFAKTSKASVGRLPRDATRLARYAEKDEEGIFAWANFRGTGANSYRKDRLKLYYPIWVTVDTGAVTIPSFDWSETESAWLPTSSPTDKQQVVFPIDDDNEKRVWTLGWDRAQEEAETELVAKNTNGKWQVHRKYRPNQEGALPGTWWADPATTGHAVINLNRQDNGQRKYILVEQGEYFDTVTKPRVQKVVYSADWKEGKATALLTGISHAFKVLKLESYEDTLNNLQLRRSEAQQSLLDKLPQSAQDDYLLRYLLDIESRGSLLSVEQFNKPFDCKLKVTVIQQVHMKNEPLIWWKPSTI